MTRSEKALSLALGHLALFLLLNLTTLVGVILPRQGLGALGLCARFPLLGAEGILVSAALGLLALPLLRLRGGAALALLLGGVLGLHLCVDQNIYRLYGNHFTPSWSDGSTSGARFFADSLWAEAGPLFLLALALFALGQLALGLVLFAAEPPSSRPVAALRALVVRLAARLRTRGGALALVLIVMLGLLVGAAFDNRNLQRHPLVALLLDLAQPRRPPRAPLGTGKAEGLAFSPALYRLAHGSVQEPAPTRDALAAFQATVRARPRKPNLVLVILESVASRQLLDAQGRLQPRYTPWLAQAANQGILLDSIYTSFPGTTRSHVPLATGGYTITWGSSLELQQRYSGSALPGVLRAAGHATAFFSSTSLEAEGLSHFYQSIGGFDALFDFGAAPPEVQERHRISSWGGDEEAIRQMAVKWLDERADKQRPFFLQLAHISTHHPYTPPPGYQGPEPGKNAESRYRNALHHNDAVLRRLSEALKERGLWEDTLIAITGDHGETFGDDHEGNFSHNNFLYEENIRSFLLLIDPRRAAAAEGPLRSARVGSHGDLLPTLAGLLGAPLPTPVLGQDLLAPTYQPKVVYFHKLIPPELWGLRDGQWKYIARKNEAGQAALYDLSTDPTEQRDVAAAHPQVLAEYQARCAAWFAGVNNEYIRHLPGFSGGQAVSADDVQRQGLQRLRFGRVAGGKLTFSERFNPYDLMLAHAERFALTGEQTLYWEWTSPGGKHARGADIISAGEGRPTFRYPASLPMEAGRWSFAVGEKADKVTLTQSFTVDPAEPLPVAPALRVPVLQALEVTQGQGLAPGAPLRADAPLLLRTRWQPRRFSYRVLCSFQGPGGATHQGQARVVPTPMGPGGAPPAQEALLDCGPKPRLAPGAWTATVLAFDQALAQVPLQKVQFQVLP